MPTEWPTQRIRLDLIDPNPWNPNRMSEETMAKLRRSVEDEGMGILGHIVVRPRKKGRYELVDGEHRLRIYQEMGLEDAEAIVADLSDENAKVAGLVLNELRGRPSLPELGKVLGDLAASRPVADLAKVLPWREGVIKNLATTYGSLQEEVHVPLPPPKLPRNAVQIRQGDVRTVLKRVKSKTVQTVVTSPPYWGLRDFSGGSGDDEDLAVVWADGWRGQLGLEPTPELYVDHIVEVFREVRRVLRDDGTVWLNMGDCYAQSSSRRRTHEETAKDVERNKRYVDDPNYRSSTGWTSGRMDRAANTAVGNLKPKDLVLMPARIALALQADGWWVRKDIIWSKPNPMPESATDRPTSSHEYVFLLAKSGTYFYDAEAVREPPAESTVERRHGEPYTPVQNPGYSGRGSPRRNPDQHVGEQNMGVNPAGRNLRDVWTITTQPYPEAHFATFPEALVEPCVQAGTSAAGCCAKCGTPWKHMAFDVGEKTTANLRPDLPIAEVGTRHLRFGRSAEIDDLGFFQACECEGAKRRPCLVLDPFAGSGTVGVVAYRLGRRFLGVELKEEYVAMALDRIARSLQVSATKAS